MMTCNDIDDLLLEGDPEAMRRAARHAEGCAPCMEKLADWNEISDVAHGMHASWENDLLWPRIERTLAAERKRRSAFFLQIAAAALLLATLGSGLWLVERNIHRNEFDQSILRMTAVDDVERTERAHLAAIERLEKVAQPKLEAAATPLVVNYKEKLMLLDDAIAECQTNIQQNRQNAHLRRQLLAIYSEKQRTLQDLVREEPHVSTQ